MNYKNYAWKMVEEQGVELVGWPFDGEVINPGSLGSRLRVRQLLEALKVQNCHWVVLSAAEHEDRVAENKHRAANGESIYPQRKKAMRANI
jgi:hypothetical protein